jgi:hypothetical protein
MPRRKAVLETHTKIFLETLKRKKLVKTKLSELENSVSSPLNQGCQIFLGTIFQKGGKIYQITTKLPNGPKMYLLNGLI